MRKIIFSIIFVLVGIFVIIQCNSFISIRAENNTVVLTPEMYTESDNLLDANGVKTNDTIKNFANRVLSSDITYSIRDFDMVIPNEYIKPANKNVCYYYFGKEYGFYVRHRYDAFAFDPSKGINELIDIILVDFISGFEDITAEKYLKVNVLFSETFFNAFEDNENDWYLRRVNPNTYLYSFKSKLYITNTSFIDSIYNEHDKNYGDLGYDKNTDNGAIISQSRINYKVYDIFTEIDPTELLKFSADIIIGLIPVVSDIYDEIGTVVSFIEALGSSVVTVTTNLEQNNENNIYTLPTKNYQKENLESYYRSICIHPKDSVYLINNESYIENIITLNDSSACARLHQCFNFDICDENGILLNDTNEDGKIPFTFTNVQTVYDEEYVIDFDNSISNEYYMLPLSNQRFKFNAEQSGKYYFNLNDEEVEVYVNGSKIIRNDGRYFINVVSGNEYIIELKNITQSSKFGKFILNNSSATENISIPANGEYLIRIDSDTADKKILQTNNPNVVFLTCYDNNFSVFAQNINRSEYLISLGENDTKYLVLKNNSNEKVTVSLVERDNTIVITESGSNHILTTDNEYYQIVKFNALAMNKNMEYSFYFNKNGESGGYTVSCFNESWEACGTFAYNNNFTRVTVTLSSMQPVYFIVTKLGNANVDITVAVAMADTPKWIVNGSVVYTNEYYLKRGESFTLDSYYTNDGTMIVSDNNGYLIIENGNTITADELADLSRITLTYEIPLNNENGALYDYKFFYVNIVAEDEMNNAVTTWSDQTGYGLKLKTTALNNLKFKIIAGSYVSDVVYFNNNLNVKKDTYNFFTEQAFSDVLNVKSYVEFRVEIVSVIYSIKNGNLISNAEVENKKKGVSYNSITGLNNLYAVSADSASKVISCERHLENIRYSPSDRFILTANISLNNRVWQPITEFKGYLNGNGKKISDFEIVVPETDIDWNNYAFIGKNSGTVVSLNLSNINIKKTTQHDAKWVNIAGVVGNNTNTGVIQFCTVTDSFFHTARTQSRVGGVAGYNTGYISNCYFKNGTIKGNGDIGGVVGVNLGTVYACGSENAELWIWLVYYNRSVGGVIGYNNGGQVTYSTAKSNFYYLYGYTSIITPQPAIGYVVGNLCDNSTYYVNSSLNCTYNIDKLTTAVQKKYCFGEMGGNCGTKGTNLTLSQY